MFGQSIKHFPSTAYLCFFSFQMGGKKSSLLQKVNHPLAKFSSPLLPPFGTRPRLVWACRANTNVKNGRSTAGRREPACRQRHEAAGPGASPAPTPQPGLHTPGQAPETARGAALLQRARKCVDGRVHGWNLSTPAVRNTAIPIFFIRICRCMLQSDRICSAPPPCVAEISADARRSGRDPSGEELFFLWTNRMMIGTLQ
jgi:hypothetical protein